MSIEIEVKDVIQDDRVLAYVEFDGKAIMLHKSVYNDGSIKYDSFAVCCGPAEIIKSIVYHTDHRDKVFQFGFTTQAKAKAKFQQLQENWLLND